MDPKLVSSVRDLLSVLPLEYRIYSRLKRQYRDDLPEFSVARAAGPNAQLVFTRRSGEPRAREYPASTPKLVTLPASSLRYNLWPCARAVKVVGYWVNGGRSTPRICCLTIW